MENKNNRHSKDRHLLNGSEKVENFTSSLPVKKQTSGTSSSNHLMFRFLMLLLVDFVFTNPLLKFLA